MDNMVSGAEGNAAFDPNLLQRAASEAVLQTLDTKGEEGLERLRLQRDLYGISPLDQSTSDTSPSTEYQILPDDPVALHERGIQFLRALEFPVDDPKLGITVTNEVGILRIHIASHHNKSGEHQTILHITPYGEQCAPHIGELLRESGATKYLVDPSQTAPLESEGKDLSEILEDVNEPLYSKFGVLNQQHNISDDPNNPSVAGSLRFLTQLAQLCNRDFLTIDVPLMTIETVSTPRLPLFGRATRFFCAILEGLPKGYKNLMDLAEEANSPAVQYKLEVAYNMIEHHVQMLLLGAAYPFALSPAPGAVFVKGNSYHVLDFQWEEGDKENGEDSDDIDDGGSDMSVGV